MFENHLPVMESRTCTLKHTRLFIIRKSKNAGLRKHVYLKTLCLSWKMNHARSKHVCTSPSMQRMPQTYVHAQAKSAINAAKNQQMSMYVFLKNLCLSSKIKHTRSSIQVQNRKFQQMKIWAEHVCMFEIRPPVMENQTYTLKYTRLIIIQKPKKAGV